MEAFTLSQKQPERRPAKNQWASRSGEVVFAADERESLSGTSVLVCFTEDFTIQ
jgi:hypothetical protein